jgi:hypothetical protein
MGIFQMMGLEATIPIHQPLERLIGSNTIFRKYVRASGEPSRSHAKATYPQ